MRLLYFLADMFIDTFGITHPTEKARKHAAFFILGLIVIAISIVSVVGYVIHLSTL